MVIIVEFFSKLELSLNKGMDMKLNYKRTIFIGLAFLSICAFWQLYETIVPLILTMTFGLGDTMTGAIMALDNILALFLLPFFGSFSDKTDSRLGKRTPFIIIGTFFAVIAMMLLPYADQKGSFILFIVALGIVLVAMSTYRSPAVALMTDLTPKPLRSKANAVINLMGALGSVIILTMISILVPKQAQPDYTAVFLFVAVIMLVAVVILVTTIREKSLSEKVLEEYPDLLEIEAEKKGMEEGLPWDIKKSLIFILLSIFLWFTAFNAVTTAFSRYAVSIWGLEGGGFANVLIFPLIAALVSYIPAGALAMKIGRKMTIIIGILLMTISYGCVFLLTDYSPFVIVALSFTGIGWAFINVNSYPMVVEICRSSDIGKYTGLYYSFSMAAQIVTPIFSGYLFEKWSYLTLFPYAAVFSLISLLTMFFVKHGDSKLSLKSMM